MRRYTCLFIIILFYQAGYSQQLFFDSFTEESGLSSSATRDIAQDQQGYIWFATHYGVNRFDGVALKQFTAEDGWPVESEIEHIIVDKNNVLWVGSADTCLFLVNNINSHHQVFYMVPSIKNVVSIKEDKNGDVFVATLHSICILRNYRIVRIIEFKEEIFEFDYTDDNLYVSSYSNGLIIHNRKTDHREKLTTQTGLLSNNCTAVSFLDDTLYIGHDIGYTVTYQNKVIKKEAPIEGGLVRNIYKDPTGKIWVLTNDGIAVYKNQKQIFLFNFHTNNFIANGAHRLFIDKENNFWISIHAHGIVKIPSMELIRFSAGLAEIEPVYGIQQENDSTYWLSYFQFDNLVRLTLRGHVVEYDTIPVSRVQPQYSTFDPLNQKIVISGINGIAEIKNGKITTNNDVPSLTDYELYRSYYHTADSSVYIGSYDGVNKYKNGRFTKIFYHLPNGEKKRVGIPVVTGDKNGVFLGTFDGILTIKNDSLIMPGIFNRIYEPDKNVLSLICDQNGQFWADINNNCVLRFWIQKGNIQYRKYNLKKSLGIKGPFNFFSHKNTFWLRTFDKLYQCNLQSLYDEKPIIENILTKEDGIKPEVPNMTTYYIDKYEYLWILGTYGLIRYDYHNTRKNTTETTNSLRTIKINDEVQDWNSYTGNIDPATGFPINPQFDDTKNEIGFEYIGICHASQPEVKYKTRLMGLTNRWSNPTSENHITYTQLPPGDYTFQFISCNNDGLWNTNPYSYQFTVLPAWYQTWWFKLLVAIAIAAIIYSIFLLRTRHLNQQRKLQEKFTQDILQSQESERKRIAQELHDGVGQELSMLKINMEQINHEPLKNKVNKIIEDIRYLSRNIHPHYFEKLGFTKAVEILIDENNEHQRILWVHELDNINPYFNTNQQLMLFRIVQECINNTVKHSGASNAKITITKHPHEVSILIQDNGVGFNVNAEKLNSLGLLTIRERVRSLHGSLQIKSKPGQGTQTKILLPVQN